MRICPNCHVGTLHPKLVTYANWHLGQFVTAPNLPAWSCDVCAWCQIEPEALNRLLWLVGPVTRSAWSQPRPTSTPADERKAESAAEGADPDRDHQVA